MRTEITGYVVFLALFVVTLYLIYLIFKPFLPGIVWATFLVVAFQPFYKRLVGWLGGRKLTASILLSALVGAFLVVPTVLAMVKVGQGVARAYRWLSDKASEGESVLETVKTAPWVTSAMDKIGQYVDLSQIDFQGMALSTLQTLGNVLAGQTRALLSNAIQTLLTLAVVLVTMAVLFHEGPRLVEIVRRFVPLGEKDKEAAFKQMETVTRAVFFGVLMTALVQAIAGAIGFAVVGMPAVITFGAAMFFCALLPGGPVIVWGPVAVWLFLTGHPIKAVIIVVWGALVVGSVDNLLRPIFIGKGVRMHLLLVFFGILGGMMAFGLIGLFTGPLVITVFLFLLEVARREFFRPDRGLTSPDSRPSAPAPAGNP